MAEMRYGGMGWRRDLPDFRDYTEETPSVAGALAASKPLEVARGALPPKVDLRAWCSPIEDQGRLGSCTAQAGVGLMEYFERRAFGKYLDSSRLFLYKVTRNLLGWEGDTGAYLRTTMKAMVVFGILPESYLPYVIADFDKEPSAFAYSFAQSYKTREYYRLDPGGVTGNKVINTVKIFLAANLPSMFGFSVYSSIPGIGDGTGDIPYPGPNDAFLGGHAVMTVGYDDNKRIGNRQGALLVRNSWGKGWGENGYGWLPYAYVRDGLAVDFWSVVDAGFVNTDLFK